MAQCESCPLMVSLISSQALKDLNVIVSHTCSKSVAGFGLEAALLEIHHHHTGDRLASC
jgi:hypothetical protein